MMRRCVVERRDIRARAAGKRLSSPQRQNLSLSTLRRRCDVWVVRRLAHHGRFLEFLFLFMLIVFEKHRRPGRVSSPVIVPGWAGRGRILAVERQDEDLTCGEFPLVEPESRGAGVARFRSVPTIPPAEDRPMRFVPGLTAPSVSSRASGVTEVKAWNFSRPATSVSVWRKRCGPSRCQPFRHRTTYFPRAAGR